MKIAQLLTFSVETFSSLGHDFTVHTIQTKRRLDAILQILAFGGQAHMPDGVLNVDDFDSVPADVMKELRMTVFISYPAFKSGKNTHGPGGVYVFTSVATTATVEADGIRLPAYHEVQKHATNRRTVQLIGN